MDYEGAKLLLRQHGGWTLGTAGDPSLMEDGFIRSLREYRGLREKNFHHVMEALLTVGERVHRAPQIDRDPIYAVWNMCLMARVMGLRPDGMLQRNMRITARDTARLQRWVEALEWTALRLLEGRPPHRAVYHYAECVVEEEGWWDNAAFFVGLMAQAVSDPKILDGIRMISRALGKLGAAARPALPALREAAERPYIFPSDERYSEELRADVRWAIQAIEGAGQQE
jgi:hypothetical protein